MKPDGESVVSSKAPARIVLKGFELASEGAHMIEWLGRGTDFRSFVASDIEAELYAQDPGAQLLSLECTAIPEYETRAVPRNDGTSLATVTFFAVIFPLVAHVVSSGRETWRLEIRHGYIMSNVDKPADRKLHLQFQVVAQSAA
jgi:hypothetical protein